MTTKSAVSSATLNQSPRASIRISQMKKAYFNVQFGESSFVPGDDGSLTVMNVPIMAVGKWTSMQGDTAEFTPDVLKRFATNWTDNALWPKHTGGVPRDATDILGACINPRYDEIDGVNGAYADLYLHGQTEASRNAIAIVQMAENEGGIKCVSAETAIEVDPDGTVSNITFTGAALVRKGACESCRIPAFAESDTAGEGDNMPKDDQTKKLKADAEGEGADPAAAKGTPPSPGGAPSLADVVKGMESLKQSLEGLPAKFMEALKAHEAEGEGEADGEGCDHEAEKKADAGKIAELEKRIAQTEANFARIANKPASMTQAAKKDEHTEQADEGVTVRMGKDFSIRNR
jgi:hypothetical protein